MDILAIIQTILSVLALIAAVYIPEKIKWEQTYSALLSDYRGYDFAAAVQGIIDFFVVNCKRDIERIPLEYNRVAANSSCLSNDQNLHFQRRLLAQFYWQLNECSKSFFIGKKRVKKDFFSRKEANLLRIIYFMDKAIDDDENGVLFKEISSFEHVPKNHKKKNMNSAIAEMYYLLHEK